MHDQTIVRVLAASTDVTAVHVEVDEQTVIVESGSKGPQGVPGNDGIGYTVQTFSAANELAVYTGRSRWYAPSNMEILNITVSCGTPPDGASVVIDINNNGASIFTDPANRPHVFSGSNTSTAVEPDNTILNAGEYLTIDIDQVGTVYAGSDLVVVIQMKET